MRMKPRLRAPFIVALIAVACLALGACEDSEAPVIPSGITIESGDEQWSKRATPLPDPLRVRVRFEDGTPAVGFTVQFSAGGIGGDLTSQTVNTDGFGLASTRLTLADQTGTAVVVASLVANPGLTVDFTATSSEFYCPEEDPTFDPAFTSEDLAFNELFLFTRESSLFGGAGIIRITPAPAQGLFSARLVRSFDEGMTRKVVRDAAFSTAGDYFLAWAHFRDEVINIAADLSYPESGFSELESFYGSEITPTPAGILVGCDEFGPFFVGCRDTLGRFDDASYPGIDANDYASGDAVAVDPNTDDIYYIDVTGLMLMRLPMTGLTADGMPVGVVALGADEAEGASGMVVDGADGTVYLLVDTENTREIVSVTSGGVKATEVDFFVARGADDLAGRQNDLAIDREFRFLFTVDRLNDALVMWEIVPDQLSVMTANPSDTDPEALSTVGASDERVGLAVIPHAGL